MFGGSDGFARSRGDGEGHTLFAETRVLRSEMNRTCALPCPDPHRASAADEGEWIVADQFCRTLEGEGDGIVGVGAHGTEFVGDTQDYAGGIGAVGNELVIVREQDEFGIDATAGEGFGDSEFAVDIALDAEIAPAEAKLFSIELEEVEDEGRVFEVFELSAIRVEFGKRYPWIAFKTVGAR